MAICRKIPASPVTVDRILPHVLRICTLVAATVAASACPLFTSPEVSQEPALIRYYGEDARITMPDTVARATPFTVSVLTFGGGCTRTAGREDIDRSSGVSIHLYNVTRMTSGGVCTADVVTIEHRITLQLDVAGDVVVRIFGVNRGIETNSQTVALERDRTVTVR